MTEERCEHRSGGYPAYAGADRCSRKAVRIVGTKALCSYHANRRERELAERETEWTSNCVSGACGHNSHGMGYGGEDA